MSPRISIQGAASEKPFIERAVSKGKEKHAPHEHEWQLKFVTLKIKKHSQVQADKGNSVGMGEMETPRLDGRVGMGVVAFRFGFDPSGEEQQTIAFWEIKCVRLLSMSEASSVLGKGSLETLGRTHWKPES